MHAGCCERSDFTRFCIIILMLDVKQTISKHTERDFTRNVLSSMIITQSLESEQHTTDQKTTFSAEMLSLSKNACFLCNMPRKGKYVYIQ